MNKESIPVYFQPLGGPSDEEVAKAQAVIQAREKAQSEQKRSALVKCTTQTATGKGCGAMHSVEDIEYIQTHWYVSPHGCTGGDYWKSGEGQWVCPSCGHLNRLYASPDVEDLKHHFKSIRDTYDDR